MSRVAGMLAAAALVVAGLLVPAAPARAGPAEDIAALVNEARWANGQAGLIRNPAMDQVAANWAAQMAASGTMAHNPDYASRIPGGWTAAGENVAQGHPSGAAMHDGWMASPGHRANILGDYTDIGIAFLSSGGTTWGVEVFARYPGHVGPAAPAPPAPPPAAEPEAPAAPADPKPAATGTPSPTPTPEATATRPATPEPRTTAASRPADSSAPPWWPLLAGILLVAAAGVTTATLRRRGRAVRPG